MSKNKTEDTVKKRVREETEQTKRSDARGRKPGKPEQGGFGDLFEDMWGDFEDPQDSKKRMNRAGVEAMKNPERYRHLRVDWVGQSSTQSITPSVLDTIGRALCRSGESLHVIDVRGGRVRLTPTASWAVHGSDDPASWRYRVTLSGPSSTRTFTLPAASVLHVRYAPHPSRPWAGRSPVLLAIDTARAAGLLETATAGELNFTQSQMLTPRRSAGDFGVADSLTPDTIQKIVSAFYEHVNTGAFVIPADVTPQRLGPDPPDSFPLLRDRLENSLLALHGLPPALVAARGTGTAMREAFRQVLHSLLKPLGAILGEELREKLHPDAELSFDSLRAGDITGSARAFGSLVTAGLTPKSAAEVVGLEGVDVREVPA